MKYFIIIYSSLFLACFPNKNEEPGKERAVKTKVERRAEPVKIETAAEHLASDKNLTPKKDLLAEKDSSSIIDKDTSVPAKKVFAEADAAFQWDANQKLGKLLKSFGNTKPDYYAGAFINDKGNLVINIKGNLEKGKTAVSKVIGKKNIIFQTQKYSHQELTKLMDYLNKFAQNPKNKEYSSNMKIWGVNEYENVIDMGLKDNSPEKIKEFKEKISPSPAIKFFQTDGIVLQ